MGNFLFSFLLRKFGGRGMATKTWSGSRTLWGLPRSQKFHSSTSDFSWGHTDPGRKTCFCSLKCWGRQNRWTRRLECHLHPWRVPVKFSSSEWTLSARPLGQVLGFKDEHSVALTFKEPSVSVNRDKPSRGVGSTSHGWHYSTLLWFFSAWRTSQLGEEECFPGNRWSARNKMWTLGLFRRSVSLKHFAKDLNRFPPRLFRLIYPLTLQSALQTVRDIHAKITPLKRSTE